MGNCQSARVSPALPSQRRRSSIGILLADAQLATLASPSRVEENDTSPKWKKFWLFLETTMGYVDMGTDIATMVNYATLNPSIAIAQGVILVISLFAQFLTSVGLGQPFWVGLVGVIGMKPFLEAWRDAMDAKPFPRQKQGNDFMLFLTRFIEMVVSRWVV